MSARPKRYFGTSFNARQVGRLQWLLGLEKKTYAAQVAIEIHSWVWHCDREDAARRKTPDIRVARTRLERIATAAAQLARLLEEEPLAEDLVRQPGTIIERAELRDDDGVISMAMMHEIDQAKLRTFIETAKTVRYSAEVHLEDTNHRAALGLPMKRDANKSPVTSWLWPYLFKVWVWSDKKLAKTDGGPLHRFIAFVHDVYDLGDVKASTLKDAIADWQQDGRLWNCSETPSWRSHDED